MRTKTKKLIIAVIIVMLLAAAAGIILLGKSGDDNGKQLEAAALYLENQDYDKAIAVYNGIISKDESCAEAYAGLSEAYYAKKREDKALEILEEGMKYADDEQVILEKMAALFPDHAIAEDEPYYEDDENDDEYYTSETTEAVTETAVPDTETVTSEKETETSVTEQTEETTTVITTTTAARTTIAATTTAATTAPTTTTRVTTTAKPVTTTTAATTTKPAVKVEVPDFTLMSVDEAYAWCSMNQLFLNVIGSGDMPTSQSPAPGSFVEEGSDIFVRCE